MHISRFDTQFESLWKYNPSHTNSFNLGNFSPFIPFLISIIYPSHYSVHGKKTHRAPPIPSRTKIPCSLCNSERVAQGHDAAPTTPDDATCVRQLRHHRTAGSGPPPARTCRLSPTCRNANTVEARDVAPRCLVASQHAADGRLRALSSLAAPKPCRPFGHLYITYKKRR